MPALSISVARLWSSPAEDLNMKSGAEYRTGLPVWCGNYGIPCGSRSGMRPKEQRAVLSLKPRRSAYRREVQVGVRVKCRYSPHQGDELMHDS